MDNTFNLQSSSSFPVYDHKPLLLYDLVVYTAMDSVSEGVSLLIHEHPMVPWNDMGRGDCCRRYESITDGYYCKICDFFVHKICGDEASEYIQHQSHSLHTLQLLPSKLHYCDLCGRNIKDRCYCCEICDFDVCLYCAKYPPPPEVIDISETHPHKLTHVKERTEFVCDAKCGKRGYGFPYKCDECDLAFHVECVWYSYPSDVIRPKEVNHSYHSLHPLKLLTGHPP
ncbi:unnamed protein product, partial [Microthlaspi erraticum]